MDGELEANLAVLLVLVVAVRPLKLGDASILRPPLRRVVHVVGPSGRERRHGCGGSSTAVGQPYYWSVLLWLRAPLLGWVAHLSRIVVVSVVVGRCLSVLPGTVGLSGSQDPLLYTAAA